MKRILATIALLALILIGCRHIPAGNPVIPNPAPAAAGCACKITAMGISLVSAMSWTNPTSGHTGSGGSVIYPEFGSSFSVFADPSISCSTNAPNIAYVSFTCKGTNMPYAIPITLPVNCDGVQGTVTGDCDKCSFSATATNGFWCNVYSPRK